MIDAPTMVYDPALGRFVPAEDDELYGDRTPKWVADIVADRRRRERSRG